MVNLSATIPDNTDVGNISQYIQNTDLYDKNKLQVGSQYSQEEVNQIEKEGEGRYEIKFPPGY